VNRYQKGKTNLDFTEARDSEWQWHQLDHMQVCTVLQTDSHASTPPLSFYRPDALPAAQPTASKHRRHTLGLRLGTGNVRNGDFRVALFGGGNVRHASLCAVDRTFLQTFARIESTFGRTNRCSLQDHPERVECLNVKRVYFILLSICYISISYCAGLVYRGDTMRESSAGQHFSPASNYW